MVGESTGKGKVLRQDIPMVERGSKKRDEERERAFLTQTRFPSLEITFRSQSSHSG